MYAKVTSLGVTGLAGYIVQVEADLSGGLPQFNLVGLPDSAVKESSERVRSAIKNLHYEWPASRITINLAPADVRKTGPVYDLPVFVGILAAQGKLPVPGGERAFLGELGLDGTLRPVTGVLPMAMAAVQNGVKELFLPAENAAEAAVAEGLTVYTLPAVPRTLCCTCAARIPSPRPRPKDTTRTVSGWGRIWPMCAGKAKPAAPWRSPPQAGTIYCWSARRVPVSPCWQSGCRAFCRR